MIEYTLDAERAILHVRPTSSLEKGDFVRLAQAVDPFLEEHGDLAGLVIEAPHFHGWDSLGAMVQHFRFVRDHHEHVRRIALVTDSRIGDVAERLASHFVAAEIRHFPSSGRDAAERWILGADA